MRKRITSALLCAVLIVSMTSIQVYAEGGGLSNFEKIKTYSAGQFADVPDTSAFSENVKASYEYGIMQGKSNSSFGIRENITRLASLIIACRLNTIYNSGQDSIESDYNKGNLQSTYLAYAQDNGIYNSFSDWSTPIKRYEFAQILNSALPDTALGSINTVEDDKIPDVPSSLSYSAAVYRLYRAGVLTGNDSKGSFQPQSYITRGAACAIATRMADISLRKSITLTASSVASTELNAEQVYAKCSSAVAYIEVSDSTGAAYASGSGFFIDSSGTFVTCYHVIDGCSSAKVQTKDGKTYTVSGVYDYSKANDWAVLKVNGSRFNTLTIGTENEINAGGTVYAIGSPKGLSDSISQGIISNISRTVDGTNYIQTTAAISPGSSGGALIDKYGNVIGITAGAIEDGQSLNLAIPLSYISGYSKSSITPLSTLFASTDTSSSTSSQSRHDDIFNYFCWIVYTYGDTEIAGNPAVEYTCGDKETADVVYDLQNKCITIMDHFTFDDGASAYTFLVVTQSLEPYQVAYSYYPNSYATEASASGSGNVSPYDFTSASTFTFGSYSGTDQKGDAAICTLMVASTVNFLDWLLSTHLSDGYTINDLGFYAIYKQNH